MKDIVLELDGLYCAHCVGEIEEQTRKLPSVSSADLNFVTKKLNIDIDNDGDREVIIEEIKTIVNRIDPEVVVLERSEEVKSESRLATIELNGLDCAGCAEKIETLAKDIAGVNSANLNFVAKKMDVELENFNEKDKIVGQIKEIVNRLEPGVEVVDITKEVAKEVKDILLELEGLDCAGCAGQIENYAAKMDGIETANLDFPNQKLALKLNGNISKNEVIESLTKEINRLEPDVVVRDLSKVKKTKSNDLILKLEGLDCAGCAGQIEVYAGELEGVESANVDFANQKLIMKIKDIRKRNDIVNAITKEMIRLEPGVRVIDLKNPNLLKEEEKVEEGISKEKKELIKIGLGAVFFALPFLLKLEGSIRFASYFISYLIVGSDVIVTAFRNIAVGNALDEHFLMTIATIAAFITGEYPEGVMVMLLYKIGEYLQGLAVNHSRRSIAEAMDIRPDYANLYINGDTIVVSPEEIQIGDEILIKPGERVPLDGIVIEGESTLDTSSITGESVPRSIKAGDEIVSGVVNNNGLLKVRVNKEFGEATVSKILDLVENASSRKAPTENFITKFSRVYTPIVVILAIAVATIPPLVTKQPWMDWLYNAAVFLVISCPCALVISVPLGFFGGIGAASKEGILVKGGNYLEALNDVDTLVFDKTGTITKGSFTVTEIKSYNEYTEDEILEIGAYGEAFSNHPIGTSIVDYYSKKNVDIDRSLIQEYKEIPGRGIDVKIKDKNFLLGNQTLLEDNDIEFEKIDSIGTLVYIAENKKHIGTIVVSDEIKPGVEKAIEDLKKSGIKETIILSGDNKLTVDKVAEATGITKAYGELLPQDKVEIFEDIIKRKHRENEKLKVAFVGDGVNDAPVLARADVGIAMGGLGSDAAIEAADIVILTDEIQKISTGMKVASKTKRIVTQNIILALSVKIIVLLLGAFGMASMWQAVFADVGVSIIAIFNSIRALKID